MITGLRLAVVLAVVHRAILEQGFASPGRDLRGDPEGAIADVPQVLDDDDDDDEDGLFVLSSQRCPDKKRFRRRTADSKAPWKCPDGIHTELS